MPSDNYYESLPKKQLSVGALIWNEARQLLIVKPIYRDGWLLPGGVVEALESPKTACYREIKEEIGLDLAVGSLVCVDYSLKNNKETQTQRDKIQFIFDAGVLTVKQIDAIRLQAGELSEYRFVSLEEAAQLLNIDSARRLRANMQSREHGTCVYLENGKEV